MRVPSGKAGGSKATDSGLLPSKKDKAVCKDTNRL